ncbi:acetyltransferase [Vibrio cholerae]|nr:acetyltransferase [Vibrio cholerae]
MFMTQCFRFGWRRCSPLNWALCVFLESFHSSALIIQT